MPTANTRNNKIKKSRTKSNTKRGLRFRWWMGLILVVVVAVAGILVLRYSQAARSFDFARDSGLLGSTPNSPGPGGPYGFVVGSGFGGQSGSASTVDFSYRELLGVGSLDGINSAHVEYCWFFHNPIGNTPVNITLKGEAGVLASANVTVPRGDLANVCHRQDIRVAQTVKAEVNMQPGFSGAAILATKAKITSFTYSNAFPPDGTIGGPIGPPPGPPPAQVFCGNVVDNVATAATAGQPFYLNGAAHGTDAGAIEAVDMQYFIVDRGSNLVYGPMDAKGVPRRADGQYIDDFPREVVLSDPGSYTILLNVTFNYEGKTWPANGNEQNTCRRPLNVSAAPKFLRCSTLSPSNPSREARVGQTFTVKGQARGINLRNGETVNMEYKAYDSSGRQVGATQQAAGVSSDSSGLFVDEFPRQFKFDTEGTYTIKLNILGFNDDGSTYWASNSSIIEGNNGNCEKTFAITPRPPEVVFTDDAQAVFDAYSSCASGSETFPVITLGNPNPTQLEEACVRYYQLAIEHVLGDNLTGDYGDFSQATTESVRIFQQTVNEEIRDRCGLPSENKGTCDFSDLISKKIVALESPTEDPQEFEGVNGEPVYAFIPIDGSIGENVWAWVNFITYFYLADPANRITR